MRSFGGECIRLTQKFYSVVNRKQEFPHRKLPEAYYLLFLIVCIHL